MHPHWYMMTTIMPLCFCVCVTLAILQTKSLKWSLQSNSSGLSQKRELFCLYGQYIIGSLCAVQCFLCHISNIFPDFYCVYGMSICVITYAATKSCLYGFFLERSRCVQDHAPMLPSFVWNYVFPLYIVLYFCIYAVLCPLSFRGKVVDPTIDNTVPTACLFGEYQSWVFDLSAMVDLLNCFLFLALYIWPIHSMNKQQKLDGIIGVHDVVQARKGSLSIDLREVFTYNIICSTICSVSSITFLFVMSFAKHGSIGHYLWLGGNIDIIINSLCLFLMLGTNRRYLKHIYAKWTARLSGETAKEEAVGMDQNVTLPVPEIANVAKQSASTTATSNTAGSVDIEMMEKGLQMNEERRRQELNV
eukprot:73107_1